MTIIIRTMNLGSKMPGCIFALPKKCLTLSSGYNIPYKPEERPPLTDHQKKLYPQVEQEFTDEGYPILKLAPRNRNIFTERPKYLQRRAKYNYSSREEKMNEDQDWPSVWSTAKTFVPSAVPLPIRQSFENKNPPRGKYVNTELLKIANFLHLTPGAVKRHCIALKKFCTDWPEGLSSDKEVRSHFPVTYVTRDYVHSSPTIRDVRARVVDLNVHIDDLKLDEIDEDKLIRLAAHRYNKETGEITITASACPSKVQNRDYSDYMLTALYFESIKHEKWEDDKPECDWERFYWDKSESKSKVKKYTQSNDGNVVEDYKKSLENVFEKENYENLEAYRSSVENLLGISGKSVS